MFAGIIAISLGVVYSTTLSETSGSLGTVLIAIGGFLFVVAMSRRRKEDEEKSN